MEETGDVGVVAVLARHPEVAGSGVEHDLEGLGRGTDGDGAEVLGVHVVGEGLGLGTRELVTPSEKNSFTRNIFIINIVVARLYLPLKRCIEVSTSLKCVLAVFDLIIGILTRPDSDCSSKSHS